jgi:glucans biosynthesis protein C
MAPGGASPPPFSLSATILPVRLHSLDALRAAMMLLGLVLHAAASYTTQPIGAGWPFQDARTHVFADLTAFFIHVFRMPVFFAVAGFFAALLYARDGWRGFCRNRAQRVLAPLALFGPLLLPLVIGGFAVAHLRQSGTLPVEVPASIELLRAPVLMHLWFLYYLLLLYAGALGVLAAAGRVPPSWRRAALSATDAMLSPRMGLPAAAAVTWLTLLPMSVPAIDTSAALLPSVRVVAAYAVFFAFGWRLFARQELLGGFGERWKGRLALGALAGAASLIVINAPPFAAPPVMFLIATAFRALAIWALVHASLGMFVRHMPGSRPFVRYLSDASYWMYIVHLPVVIWTAGLLAPLAAPAPVKFALVLTITTVVTVATYHWGVRSTAVGVLLNGRRYRRTRPALEVEPAGAS